MKKRTVPTCGYRHVYGLPSGRFKAQIRRPGEIKYLGSFDTADEANDAVQAFLGRR